MMFDRLFALILFAAIGAAMTVSWRLSVLIVGVVLLLVRGWLWLCGRHPFVAIFIAGFLRCLTSRR
jgi:hypothetical protein